MKTEYRMPDAGSLSADSTYPLLGVILAFGLLLRGCFFNGMTGYDEFAYAHIAGNIVRGNFRIADAGGYFGFRYLLTLPAAFFIKLFGISAFSLSAWPLLCSLGNICAVFLTGRLLFGRVVGLLGAFLCSFFPFSVTYGSILYPEEVISFLLGISAYLLFRADRAGEKNASALFLLSGIFAGLAYFARLNALLIFIFYAVYALSRPKPLRFLLVPAGLLLVLLPEAFFYCLKTGDLLFSWHSQEKKLLLDAVNFSAGLRIYPDAMFGLNLHGLSLFGYFYHIFTAALAWFLYKKKFPVILPLFLWFACLFLYLEFGPSHFSAGRYVLVHKQLRFLSMVTSPVCLVIAVFLSSLGRKARAGILAGLLVSSVIGAWKMSGYCNGQSAPFKLAFAYMKDSPPGSVFVPDTEWAHHLDFYFKTPLTSPYFLKGTRESALGVKPLSDIAAAGQIRNSWLVVDTRELPAPGREILERTVKKAVKVVHINGFIRLYYVR